jgi:sulfoxide reductase heme-binding subunit YedZ
MTPSITAVREASEVSTQLITLTQLIVSPTVHSAHDSGVRQVGGLHAACFVFLTDSDEIFSWVNLTIPIIDGGQLRWAFGIVGLEVMTAILISTGLVKFFVYRRWLRFHQMAYIAVGITIVHSWLGAVANGHLSIVWLGGLTLGIPTVVLAVLRFVPSKNLVGAGVLSGG